MNALVRHLPVPPSLESAWGYDGAANVVSFWWQDGLAHDDGTLYCLGTATHAWNAYWDAPVIRQILPDGPSRILGERGTSRLVLDRTKRALIALPHEAALRLLQATQLVGMPEPGPDHFAPAVGFLGTQCAVQRALLPARIDDERRATLEMTRWLAQFEPCSPSQFPL